MSTKDEDITPAILLQHMQGMEQRLGGRIDKVEMQLVALKTTVDRNHVQTMGQLDTIDARLDDLEVVQVPKLKKAVGIN